MVCPPLNQMILTDIFLLSAVSRGSIPSKRKDSLPKQAVPL